MCGMPAAAAPAFAGPGLRGGLDDEGDAEDGTEK